jgi:hypothetical protein
MLSRNVKISIDKTIILLVVFYGCETWSLILREEHRLRVFENRVLRRMFGPKRDDVTGEWRKQHCEKLRNLYSSPNIIRLGMETRRGLFHSFPCLKFFTKLLDPYIFQTYFVTQHVHSQ